MRVTEKERERELNRDKVAYYGSYYFDVEKLSYISTFRDIQVKTDKLNGFIQCAVRNIPTCVPEKFSLFLP